MHHQRTAFPAANMSIDRVENTLSAREMAGTVARENLVRLNLQIERRARFESACLNQDHLAEQFLNIRAELGGI